MLLNFKGLHRAAGTCEETAEHQASHLHAVGEDAAEGCWGVDVRLEAAGALWVGLKLSSLFTVTG